MFEKNDVEKETQKTSPTGIAKIVVINFTVLTILATIFTKVIRYHNLLEVVSILIPIQPATLPYIQATAFNDFILDRDYYQFTSVNINLSIQQENILILSLSYVFVLIALAFNACYRLFRYEWDPTLPIPMSLIVDKRLETKYMVQLSRFIDFCLMTSISIATVNVYASTNNLQMLINNDIYLSPRFFAIWTLFYTVVNFYTRFRFLVTIGPHNPVLYFIHHRRLTWRKLYHINPIVGALFNIGRIIFIYIQLFLRLSVLSILSREIINVTAPNQLLKLLFDVQLSWNKKVYDFSANEIPCYELTQFGLALLVLIITLGLIYTSLIMIYACSWFVTEGLELILITNDPKLREIADKHPPASTIEYDNTTNLLTETVKGPPYERYFILEHLQLFFKPIPSVVRVIIYIIVLIIISLTIVTQVEEIVVNWMIIPVFTRRFAKQEATRLKPLFQGFCSRTSDVATSSLSNQNVNQTHNFQIFQDIKDTQDQQVQQMNQIFGPPKAYSKEQNEAVAKEITHKAAEKMAQKSKLWNNINNENKSSGKDEGPAVGSESWSKPFLIGTLSTAVGTLLYDTFLKKKDKMFLM